MCGRFLPWMAAAVAAICTLLWRSGRPTIRTALAVLGLALTIKMVAYVGLSPLATALVARLIHGKGPRGDVPITPVVAAPAGDGDPSGPAAGSARAACSHPRPQLGQM